ncbi:hypothetical protein Glove_441g73 [Diversispora epigaea]|uniref:Uncharacterized protein n=1 Tax=Diversispora epigaea TaxID=1348612 RepID=A0A397GWQ6_9GLOM|nr:hypothetical protein Glove_441g73 [Diversispora epigaea]
MECLEKLNFEFECLREIPLKSTIEVSRLQELYVKCAKIYRWVLERRALIEKMIEFESDPRRHFQSPFQLLEEENLVGPI